MKNILIFLPLISILLFSCKEEIEPSNDGRVTAVVYGLLDQSDSLHFIKINRAFFGGGNSLEIAKIADSSYFNTVKATVKEYQSGTLKRTWILRDTIITNKESGAFFGPEQKVYYFETTSTSPLIADEFTTYKFEAILDEGLSSSCTVTGETKLITSFSITDPTTSGSFKFASSNIELYGYTSQIIRLNVGSAAKIETNLIVEFEEWAGSTLYNTKSFTWNLGSAEEDALTNGVIEFSANGSTFYDLISKNVSNDNSITKRILKSITIKSFAGDLDFQKYLTLNKPTSGLTQSKPTFSNLNVSNDMRVIGIFASRNMQERYFYKWKNTIGTSAYSRCIDPNSMKELGLGAITGSLLFCSDHPQDITNGLPYACN